MRKSARPRRCCPRRSIDADDGYDGDDDDDDGDDDGDDELQVCQLQQQLGQKEAEISLLQAELSCTSVENERLKEQVDKLQGQLRGLICDVHNSKTLDSADRDDMVCAQAGVLAKSDDMLNDEAGHRHVLDQVPDEQPGVSSAQGASAPRLRRTARPSTPPRRAGNAAAARGPEGTAAPSSAAHLYHFQEES